MIAESLSSLSSCSIINTRSSLKSLFKSMGLREGNSSSLKDMFCAYLFLLT